MPEDYYKRSVSFVTEELPNVAHKILFVDVSLRILFDTETEMIDVQVLKKNEEVNKEKIEG